MFMLLVNLAFRTVFDIFLDGTAHTFLIQTIQKFFQDVLTQGAADSFDTS